MYVVVREYRGSFLRRMWNSSEFMRTFKQHFTMSFNVRHDHHGTMFEGRYHERNHKPELEVMRIRVWQCRGSMVWNSNAADLRSLSAS